MMETTAILAALVTPWIFWTGAGAVSVPILIHLLAKRRFKRIRWAAIEFLLAAEKQNRRRINIRELILLLLRCLAVLLIGWLLARPFLDVGSLAGMVGAGDEVHRIFVLDDSYSMAYTEGARRTFDVAVENLVAILNHLQSRPGRNRITILISSDPQHPVIEDHSVDVAAMETIRATLLQLRPSQATANFGTLLGRLRDDLKRDGHALNTVLYIVSDFQRHDWLWGSTATQQESPLSLFSEWPAGKKSLQVVLLAVVDHHRDNVALTRIEALQPQVVSGIDNRFRALVQNFGQQNRPAGLMELFLNDASLPPVPVPAIPPGQQTEVQFSVNFDGAGWTALRGQLSADALPPDNRRVTGIDVQDAIRVLLINGEPGSSKLNDEITFLKTALRPEGDVFSGFSVTPADESVLLTEDLNRFHAVVLANVNQLAAESVKRLQDFTSRGGGLAVFLGDQVDTALYNDRLFDDGQGLLPCALSQTIRVSRLQEPATLHSDDWSHPVIRVYGGSDNPMLSTLSFWSYMDCVLPESSESDADDVRILASYSTLGHPAIIEKTFGRGKVLLFTSSCDQEWNNWAVSPGYVVTMLEMGHALAGGTQRARQTTVGRPLNVRLDASQYEGRVVVRPPDYPARAEQTAQANLEDDGDYYNFEWVATDVAGVYRLILPQAQRADDELWVAVNPDPTESDLAHANEAELRSAAPDVHFEYVASAAALFGKPEDGKREYWPFVLLALIGLLMVEQTLACWFGRS